MKRNKINSPKRRANKVTPSVRPTSPEQVEMRATQRERCWVCGRTIQPGTWMVGLPHRWQHRAASVCKRGHLLGAHGIAYQRKGTVEFFDQMDRAKIAHPVTITQGCTCPRLCDLHPH